VKPLVVLCLGAPSASLLIHKNFRMTQERGKFFEVPYARYAIAALHPAYILRQGGQAFLEARRTLVQDIEAARLKVIEVRQESKQTLF
jgi:DNA polymerase